MKIAIATVQIPFVKGGAELLAKNLNEALNARGHEAEIVQIPFIDSPDSMIEDHIVAARLMDLNYSWAGRIDLCIGLKFPAYYIPHNNKVLWALHQHRAAYELFNTPLSNLKDNEQGNRVREVITTADNLYLREAKRIYTIAGNVSRRLEKYNHIHSTPLYHPCPGMDQFAAGEYGDYILMPSRINLTKRQLLALQALALAKPDVKLYIVGKADNETEKDKLLTFVNDHHLEARVRFLDFVPDAEKLQLYANARAVLFIPQDEDYGYITLEAMAAHKAVITCTDSGGPLEFVENAKTGLVVAPTPQEIARAMNEIMNSSKMAAQYGEAAYRRLIEMNITWDHVVEELTK